MWCVSRSWRTAHQQRAQLELRQDLLIMSAHQFPILRECNITLNSSSSLSRSSMVRLRGVLWVHKWCTTMPDRELADFGFLVFARFEFALERTIVHIIDQEVWTIADLHFKGIMAFGDRDFCWSCGCQSDCQKRDDD